MQRILQIWTDTLQEIEQLSEVRAAARDNIHAFQVGKDGARGIDITTCHGKDIGFSFLNIEEKPSNAEQRLFEANWKKL